MDTHYINGVVLAFLCGFIVACVLIALVLFRVESKRSKVVSNFLSDHERLRAAWDGKYRELLQKLEAGDSEGAKRSVCLGIAAFYHIEGSRESSQVLQAEKQKIETQAKSSVMLATAIKETSELAKSSPYEKR
jgi:tellurite resistance protein